jgi:hypothetical protein
MVVGAGRTCLSVSRTAMLLGFSLSAISCVSQERQKEITNLIQLCEASTWASIPVEVF